VWTADPHADGVLERERVSRGHLVVDQSAAHTRLAELEAELQNQRHENERLRTQLETLQTT
jgi:multidrug resistance efflux pump